MIILTSINVFDKIKAKYDGQVHCKYDKFNENTNRPYLDKQVLCEPGFTPFRALFGARLNKAISTNICLNVMHI